MCPPNSDTPFPCPFWGCPFAFKGREEIKKHLILIHHPAINNYNNHYNAGCIRGVDVVGLHEVTRDMFFDRYMKVSIKRKKKNERKDRRKRKKKRNGKREERKEERKRRK